MVTKWRVNGIDSYGQFSIDCNTQEELDECFKNINCNGDIEDLWIEVYDEEGWRA